MRKAAFLLTLSQAFFRGARLWAAGLPLLNDSLGEVISIC
jgi:hypothetical protein